MKIAPYGSWQSPITSEVVVTGSVRLGDTAIEGDSIYWVESRPEEAGRHVLVCSHLDGSRRDLTPPPFNVRNRVHEYGGGAFAVYHDHIAFSNWTDQRVYWIAPTGQITPMTAEGTLSFADFCPDPSHLQVLAVREDGRDPEKEATNTIVAISYDPLRELEHGRVLIEGSDFYANPRVSLDGNRLCWIAWNHPNMPWDGCELWIGDFDAAGNVVNRQQITGGATESITQPEWTPSGDLIFVSDRTGWWNLYRWQDGEIQPLLTEEAEYGEPPWVFGEPLYAVISDEVILAASTQHGSWRLQSMNTTTGTVLEIRLPSTEISHVRASREFAVFHAGSPVEATAVVRLNLATGKTAVLRRSAFTEPARGYLSVPGAIEFPTTGGRTAHAFYYPPQNQDYEAIDGELPPLIVISHGGPTAATTTSLNTKLQYWTSRGFAILDVNYGGSSGYGREYRERLNGAWGIVDVDDCVNGARHLVAEGLADPERLIIRGSSASGYTTLAAITFHDVFRIGVSHYGICDLEAMTHDTHKFESRYLDRMVGPWPAAQELYHDRSPINHVDRLNCALLLFQGLEDRVVPPNQAEMMYKAVAAKGLPVAYVPFEGEQHGFRQAANIRRALDAELYFHSRVFGFDLPETIEPVPIANL